MMKTTTACILVTLLTQGWSFAPSFRQRRLKVDCCSTLEPQIFSPTVSDLTQLKSDLVQLCNRKPKPSLKEVQMMVQEVEVMGEQVRQIYISSQPCAESHPNI
jgi:hypothetical protein